MAMVLGAAIVPLSVIGVLASRSAVRSGKLLLRDQLQNSAAAVVAAMDTKWDHRRGELLLLAGNEAVAHIMGGTATAADSQYLAALRRQLAPVFPEYSYRDPNGDVVWQSSMVELPVTEPARPAPPARVPTVEHSVPVRKADGTIIGRMDVRVALSGLLASDSVRLTVPGAVLSLRDRETGILLTPMAPAELVRDTGELRIRDSTWLSLRSRVQEPALDIIVGAPTTAYVLPFERAGRVGLLA